MTDRDKNPKVEVALQTISHLNSMLKKQNPKNPVVIQTYSQVYTGGVLQVIPTGIAEIDEATGVGGLVKGTMVELFGPESSGKSYVAYCTIASCQKIGGVAALIDAEQSAHKLWLEQIGIDTNALLYENDSISMEEHLQRVESLCGHVDMIVIDSTAALVPRSELEGQIGDVGVAAQARVLSPAIRKLMMAAKGTDKKGSKPTLIIWINQIREKMGVMWGNPETTPGGRALKFYSHMRIDVRRTGIEKVKMGEDEVPVAQNSKGTIVKNKLGIPMKKFEFRISFESNLTNPLVLLVQVATKKKIFYKTKGEYKFVSLEDEKVVTGTTDFVALANWMHKSSLVEEVVNRVTEAFEQEGEAVPDFVSQIDENTAPPHTSDESADRSETSQSETSDTENKVQDDTSTELAGDSN